MNDCFLTNKKGDYFLSSNIDFSSYQGWFIFFEEKWDLLKLVDSVIGAFPKGLADKTLFLESNSEEIVIDLDIRWIHDFNDEGRIYDVYEKNNFLIIKYTKFHDDSLSDKEFVKYLAIKGLTSYDLIKQWIKKFYPYDYERKSLHELYVFRLLKGKAKNIIIGCGKTEEEAIISSLVELTKKEKDFDFLIKKGSQKKLYDEERETINVVSNAFYSCIKQNKNKEHMVFAGYPWFYQVWARDECISMYGLFFLREFEILKEIIMRNIKRIKEDGILPNRFPHSVLGSADATGWLFQRIRIILEQKKDFFTKENLLLIENKLDFFLDNCKKKSHKGAIYNKPKETWMDTTFDSVDTREGARVEIQALYLSALQLKINMREALGDKETASKKKHSLRKKKTLIRKQLIKNNVLMDGFNKEIDETVRPNVFLAYYAYPELAMAHQWNETFNQVLKGCWLGWGGLSSISKDNNLFKDTYSGMDNKSYHRGDSWFFVNNIVALCLFDFDKKKYEDKIKKIKAASIKELKSGFKGCCAEISSAKELSSKGCLSQAWSASTLLELILRTN